MMERNKILRVWDRAFIFITVNDAWPKLSRVAELKS